MLTKPQVASILRFIANTLLSENEVLPIAPVAGSIPMDEQTAPVTEAPKRRGRPAKTEVAVNPTEPGNTAQTPASSEPAKPAEPPKGGKTLDELKALIAPLVKAARGGEVKALLNKHAPADYNASESNPYTLSLLSERPEVHDAFVQDIEMLKM